MVSLRIEGCKWLRHVRKMCEKYLAKGNDVFCTFMEF